MIITKFGEKLNKLDNNIYTIEEVVNPVSGVYEADLEHDNINPNTISYKKRLNMCYKVKMLLINIHSQKTKL